MMTIKIVIEYIVIKSDAFKLLLRGNFITLIQQNLCDGSTRYQRLTVPCARWIFRTVNIKQSSNDGHETALTIIDVHSVIRSRMN